MYNELNLVLIKITAGKFTCRHIAQIKLNVNPGFFFVTSLES